MRFLALAALLLLLPAAAGAAPPLNTLELPRFRIHHTPAAEGVAAQLSATLELERSALAEWLGRDWEGTTDVLVADGAEELAAVAPAGVRPPAWAAGVAVPSQNLLLLNARVLPAEGGRRVLVHELAHLALARSGHGRWPRWFQEGFAMFAAGEWSLSRHAAMYRSTRREGAIPLSALAEDWPDSLSEVEVAYAQSYSFVAHLYEQHGPRKLQQLVDRVSAGEPFEAAFKEAFGAGLAELEAGWREEIAHRYGWVPILVSEGTLWAATALLFLLGGLRLLRRRKARLMEMELEEAAREAALRIAAAERAQAVAALEPGGPPPGSPEELH